MVECWAEPGFHRFWRVWNPLYGFYLHKLYVALGGRDRPITSALAVFVFCGFVLHDLLGLLTTGRFSLSTTFSFVFFGLAALLNRQVAARLGQDRWHRAANVALNLTLIVGLTLAGMLLSHLLLRR